MRQSPEFSSMCGYKKYDDLLEEFTEERFEEDFHECRKFL